MAIVVIGWYLAQIFSQDGLAYMGLLCGLAFLAALSALSLFDWVSGNTEEAKAQKLAEAVGELRRVMSTRVHTQN